MAPLTTDELNALTKPELLRLLKVIRRRMIDPVRRVDVLAVQWEEAQEQAQAALETYLALSPKVRQTHEEAMAAGRTFVGASTPAKFRAAEKAANVAMAAANAAQAEKDRAWAAYQRHERRSSRLYQQLEDERNREASSRHHDAGF